MEIIDGKICFETAWSPPIGILKKLAELYKDYKFELDYFAQESDYGGKATAEWKDGKVLFEDKEEELIPLGFMVKNLDEYKEIIAFQEQQQELVKNIADNLEELDHSLSPEKALGYVELYRSTFGDEGLDYLNEEVNSMISKNDYHREMDDDRDEPDEEFYDEKDNLIGKFERLSEKYDNAYSTYDEFIKWEEEKIAAFGGEQQQQKPEQTPPEPVQTITTFGEKPEPAQPTDSLIKTANKAGYVQGVCESLLAFNTDKNREIMSEATVTMLSKKMMAEMNVTKDMAQKYANPKTYKALEQCLFTPKPEQKREQTQGFKR